MRQAIIIIFLIGVYSCNSEVELSSRTIGGTDDAAQTYPLVLSVSPDSYGVKGGTTITINGTDFSASATVSVGGEECTDVNHVSSTELTCNLPYHYASVVDVVVSNSDAYSGTLLNGFTYNSYLYASNQSGSPAISRMKIDSGTGTITFLGTTSAPNGAYGVEVDPTNTWLYVAGANANKIAAYEINHSDGSLTEIAGSPFNAGSTVVGVTVSKDSKCLISSNWTGAANAKVTSFSINSTTGALTKVADYAGGNNPSLLAVDPQNRFVFAANYGASSVSAYTMNTASCTLSLVGNLTSVPSPDGIAVHPNGTFVYAGNATASGGVTAMSVNQTTGALSLIGTYTTSSATNGSGVEIDKTGTHLYVTSRAGGVANQGKVWGYSINQSTGALSVINNYATHTGPNDVRILGSGEYVFTCNTEGNSVNAFSRNLSDGTLTPASPASFDLSGGGGLSPGVIGITF